MKDLGRNTTLLGLCQSGGTEGDWQNYSVKNNLGFWDMSDLGNATVSSFGAV